MSKNQTQNDPTQKPPTKLQANQTGPLPPALCAEVAKAGNPNKGAALGPIHIGASMPDCQAIRGRKNTRGNLAPPLPRAEASDGRANGRIQGQGRPLPAFTRVTGQLNTVPS